MRGEDEDTEPLPFTAIGVAAQGLLEKLTEQKADDQAHKPCAQGAEQHSDHRPAVGNIRRIIIRRKIERRVVAHVEPLGMN